ncbi:AMIN-like domain-containing (lipo)protein [Nocardioides conyzicola]
MRTYAAAPALLTLALLAGCGGSDGSAPPFAAGTGPDDGGHGSGNGLALTGVRTTHESDFDRIVFELGGTGTPGWRAEYTAHPVYEGSGNPVTLRGTTYLSVNLRGLGLPPDTGVVPYGDDSTRVPGADGSGIVEIAPGGVFEGEQQAYVRLAGAQRPFRVFALTDPTRVVVDVADR